MPFSEFILRDFVKKIQKKFSERQCEGRTRRVGGLQKMTGLARNGASRHVMTEGDTQWRRASHKVWRCVIARSEATKQSTMEENSAKWIASLRSQ